jgi:uncharacterized RDD family membrane protein YckC
MSEHNPYQPPQSRVADGDMLPDGRAELAGRGQRLGAAIIDTIIGLVLGIPVMMALGTWGYVGQRASIPIGLAATSLAFGMVLFVAAHGYFLKKNGQTIGKKVMAIRIADLNDGVPDFWRILGLRYLPFAVLMAIPGVGQAASLIDVLFIFRSDRRCLHDLIASTRVVLAS